MGGSSQLALIQPKVIPTLYQEKLNYAISTDTGFTYCKQLPFLTPSPGGVCFPRRRFKCSAPLPHVLQRGVSLCDIFSSDCNSQYFSKEFPYLNLVSHGAAVLGRQ